MLTHFIITLVAAGIANPEPSPQALPSQQMTLAEFIDAANGLCWVVAEDGSRIPRAVLDDLRGEVQIECIVTEPRTADHMI